MKGEKEEAVQGMNAVKRRERGREERIVTRWMLWRLR